MDRKEQKRTEHWTGKNRKGLTGGQEHIKELNREQEEMQFMVIGQEKTTDC
jgi:hypothetical protein